MLNFSVIRWHNSALTAPERHLIFLKPMNEVFASPLPSMSNEESLSTLDVIRDFWNEHMAWTFLILVFLGLLKLSANNVRRQENNIHKIWRFIVFFLSKRQMMIPLIYTLAKRDKALDEDSLKKLLHIRVQCRQYSIKKHLKKRMELERKFSEILVAYFGKLERDGVLEKDPLLLLVGKDLEFIDQKLVQLQTIYNKEADEWNRKFNVFHRIFGVRKCNLLVP